MKKTASLITPFLALTTASFGQNTSFVNLTQIEGEFIIKELRLAEGDYIFNIKNKGVAHNVGFVLIKEGADANDPENHIKEAYVETLVANGKTESSKKITLKKGNYLYFCPLNPTPKYQLTVE